MYCLSMDNVKCVGNVSSRFDEGYYSVFSIS